MELSAEERAQLYRLRAGQALERQATEITRRRPARYAPPLYQLLGTRSQAEIARAAGLPLSTVNDVLRGAVQPSVTNFLRLAKALEVSGKRLYEYLTQVWEVVGKQV